MQVAKIKNPSEKEVNPVKEVLFFQKPKTHRDLPTVLPKDTARKKVDNIIVIIFFCGIFSSIDPQK